MLNYYYRGLVCSGGSVWELLVDITTGILALLIYNYNAF